MKRFLDNPACVGRWHVLPYTDNFPASFGQPTVSISIALDVGSEFLFPPFTVCNWLGGVFRALMPEAAVHEHSNSVPGKHDVPAPAG